MGEYYKATSPKNPDTNYIEEVILERDDKGEVTKSVGVNSGPVELTDQEKAAASPYLNLRKVTDVEAERKKYEQAQPLQQVGEDVVGSGPVFSRPTVQDQPDVDQEENAEAASNSEAAGDKPQTTPVDTRKSSR